MMTKVTGSENGYMGEVMVNKLTPLHEHVGHSVSREVFVGDQHRTRKADVGQFLSVLTQLPR